MKKLYSFLLFTALCFTSNAQSLSKTMTVSGGTSVSVAANTIVSADEVNLKSSSTKYSSLFLNGALGASTIVNYDRYVNVVGTTGVNGGNDLVSLPVKATDANFGDLLTYSADGGTTTNADIITNSNTTQTLYAFGPYDNSTEAYINYDATANGTVELIRGMGYRAATDNGETIRFTGTVSIDDVTVAISTNSNPVVYDDYNNWNSVGNPYPTYLDSQMFLDQNETKLDPLTTAIYGYNSGNGSAGTNIGNFTIINRLSPNKTINIAPGQGFLLANDPNTPTNQIVFTQAMRTFTGSDDFIFGRNNTESPKLRLRAEHGTANFATEIYFDGNSSLGLDPGYDAALFNGSSSNFMIYSHLVEGNTGRNMAIQAVGTSDINDVIIPLGIKTAQGQQVKISIENSTLPADTQVYLEDNQTNTFTLLNSGDYTFTANTAISGTGRFFLRVGNTTLSTIDQESSSLQLFASEKTLFVNGLLLADTTVSVYDIQGRLVLTSNLNAGSVTNSIEATSLNRGIYVIKLNNAKQQQTKKVIIK